MMCRSAVLVRLYQPFAKDGFVLNARVQKALEKADSLLSTHDLTDLHTFYTKKPDEPLLREKSGGFRNEGINFANFGPPLASWPPTLTDASRPTSSLAWEYEILDAEVDEAMPADYIYGVLKATCVVFYRRYTFDIINTLLTELTHGR